MSTKNRAMLLVKQIENSIKDLADMMATPSDINFNDVSDAFIQLEKAIGEKAFLDASFAWLASRSDAGRLIGSTRPADFLTSHLNLSRQEAHERLKCGEDLFTPPESEPMPAPASEPGETELDRLEREQRIRDEEKRRREEDRKAQEEARERARNQASAEKQRIIQRELKNLNEHSDPSYAQLHSSALQEAKQRNPEDLRIWLREQVSRANRSGRKPDGEKDHLAAYKKRYLHLSEPDADGTVYIRGALPTYLAAKLKAALAPGLRPGVNASVPAEEDNRRRGARSVDQLNMILDTHLSSEVSRNRQGVGSIVVSMTVDDVASMTADSQFIANTGDILSPFDLLHLGASKFDIGILHDEKGQPLALGRTSRTASLYQKIALFAFEALCTCGNCNEAMIHAHVHHIDPWRSGGLTDLENLTLICPPHHGDNNDAHDGSGGMGHMEKYSPTGRTGWRPPRGGPLIFNNTQRQQYSAGAKSRAHNRGETNTTPFFNPAS